MRQKSWIKKSCLLILAAAFSSCGMSHFKSRPSQPLSPPLMPVASSPVIAADADILVNSRDQISFFGEDGASYLKIYIDHHYAGRTNIAAKSALKKWGEVLNPGRHLLRFEKWDLKPSGNWQTLPPRYQPHPLWISVALSSQTVVSLIFYNHEFKRSLTIQTRPIPKTK